MNEVPRTGRDERQERLQALSRWWMTQNQTDLKIIASHNSFGDSSLTYSQREFYYHLKRFSEALLFLESKMRWGASDTTSRDYARTVVSGLDSIMVQIAKIQVPSSRRPKHKEDQS